MDEEATASFLNIAATKGWSCVKSTKKEDCNDHYDWKIIKNNTEYKIDLKALKRINSSDNTMTDQLMLIEIQAVKNISNKTRPGWLYGKADYICFEIINGFIFVEKNKLQQYIEQHIDLSKDPIESNQNKKAHIIYTRKNRNDKFIYLYKHEILLLTEAIWRKNV